LWASTHLAPHPAGHTVWIAAALLTDLRGHLRSGDGFSTLGFRWFSLRGFGNLSFVFHRRFWFQAGGKLGRQSHVAPFVFVFFRGRYLGLRLGLRGRYGFGCFFRGGWSGFGCLHFRFSTLIRLL
jgi:hypothetical protein